MKNYFMVLRILALSLSAGMVSATEQEKTESAETRSSSSVSSQSSSVQSLPVDKVEPLGLETNSGGFVNKPAGVADKIGNEINKFLGNK